MRECDPGHMQNLLASMAEHEIVLLSSKALDGKVTMGYYVRIDESDWEIKETPESLATVREMPTKYHSIKRGGSSNGEKWFSWMNDTEIETAESVEHVFNQLGFETEKTEGGFKLLAYDSKTGQEDLFLAVLAPFTVDGSYISWVGEDDAMWRHIVKNGRMFIQEADIQWKNATPYTYYHIDFEPASMNMRSMNIDPLGADLQEQLNIAKQWDDADRAYYDKLRAEKISNENESTSLS